MLRKKSKTVPERIGSTPMLDGTTLEELRRVTSETMGKAFGEIKEDLRRINQRIASLEQDTRQPRLADITADKKAREHTEGFATAVQAKHGIAVLRTGLIPTR